MALEYRAFRLLFLATLTAHFGEQIQQVANLWQIYALTGSAVHLGFTGLARAIPILVFSLAGGVIADRVDRKRIIIFAQAANGVFAFSLATLSIAGLIDVWHIYTVTFLNATLTSASAPARRAVIAGLVPRQHLVNATALQASINQLDRIIAPSLAGILIALFGVPPTYGINAIAHLVTAISLGFVSLGTLPSRPSRSPIADLIEGLSFLKVRTIIPVLLALDVIAMLCGSYRILLPIVADQFEAGPVGFGLLSSAPAVGSLIGAGTVMYLGDFPHKGRLIVAGILGYAGALIGLALAPWFWLAFISVSALGLTDSLQAQTRSAWIQLMTPDDLRGRVSSFQHMLQAGGPALGQGLMGAAASAVTGPVALLIGGVTCAVMTLAILAARPDIRSRDVETAPDRLLAGTPRGAEIV